MADFISNEFYLSFLKVSQNVKKKIICVIKIECSSIQMAWVLKEAFLL